MTAIRNHWLIMHQAVALVQQHPKLLWLPLCNLLGICAVLMVFALPLLLPLETWTHASVRTALESWGDNGNRTLQLLALYMVIMAVLTIISATFYHAIIQAYNGNAVSLRKSFALALAKLPALLQWSLVAGVVGALIRVLEDTLAGIARWMLALIGVSWSVASILALPVLLREPTQASPVAILRHSGSLIRQRWGEGLGGMLSFRLLASVVLAGGLLAGIFLLFAVGNLMFPPDSAAMSLWRVCSVFGAATMAFLGAQFIMLLQHIYICGLYIFACEGVIPEVFDETAFRAGWYVK